MPELDIAIRSFSFAALWQLKLIMYL